MSSQDTTRQVILDSRPAARQLASEVLSLRDQPLGQLEPQQIRVRNHWLSLDQYILLRFNVGRSYMEPQAVHQVVEAASVGRIERTTHPDFAEGDWVVGTGHWQTVYQGDASGFRVIDRHIAPLEAWLGPLGLTGITAWLGVHRVLALDSDDTVLISAAAGAVGSVAVQLCTALGATVIGIAGGADQCRYVRSLGNNVACLDHRSADFADALDAALLGQHTTAVFENVGGQSLDIAMRHLAPFARVALCGLVASGYDGTAAPIADARHFLTARIRMQGFIATDHRDAWPRAIADLAHRMAAGQLHQRYHRSNGIDAVPTAFDQMLAGGKRGKHVVCLQQPDSA